MIYQNLHISYADIMQKKSGPSVEAATRIRPKTAIKWSRDQAKITVFGAFDPITTLFGIPNIIYQNLHISYLPILCQKNQDHLLRLRPV